MKISGNQTAIAEILYLLDSKFELPFACKCGSDFCHKLNCKYQSRKYEEMYGCDHFVYDVFYDGDNIKNITLLHHGYSGGNLQSGCVK
jgi:hypothetical protein